MFCEGESASKLLGSTDHSSDFFADRPQIISSGLNLQATKISGNKKLFFRQKPFIFTRYEWFIDDEVYMKPLSTALLMMVVVSLILRFETCVHKCGQTAKK